MMLAATLFFILTDFCYTREFLDVTEMEFCFNYEWIWGKKWKNTLCFYIYLYLHGLSNGLVSIDTQYAVPFLWFPVLVWVVYWVHVLGWRIELCLFKFHLKLPFTVAHWSISEETQSQAIYQISYIKYASNALPS